ncbi:MAG: noncanonical pyrimidine nucleotidase, YjjG family, partial [Clostridiales bacterium]|nr:noncanonical pyrimidine nucleotidase, YjjG family [Clostridiales bacterium]
GDSLTSDIKGGKNAGITTVWFNPEDTENFSDVIPDYEIDRLLDLLPLLETI